MAIGLKQRIVYSKPLGTTLNRQKTTNEQQVTFSSGGVVWGAQGRGLENGEGTMSGTAGEERRGPHAVLCSQLAWAILPSSTNPGNSQKLTQGSATEQVALAELLSCGSC